MKKFSAIVKVFLISILLSVNCFADDFRYPESYMPGGEYRLFGSGRGAVSNLTGEYHETGNFAVNAGNIAINNSSYKGHYEYQQDFSGHGHEVHAPFSSSNSKIGLSKKGRPEDGLKISAVYVTGTEVHPADGYDGPQGGGYPEPTGARDEYSYTFKANVTTIKVVSIEKVNQNLPPEKRITNNEQAILEKGGSLDERRTREIYAATNNLEGETLTWNEAPSLISQVLENSLITAKSGVLYIKRGAEFATGVAIAAGATIAETAEGTWNAVTHPISTVVGVGNTLAEGLWAVGESSYGLYKSDDKIDYFYDGTVENLNAISAKISDKIEDTKANAAACGDDYICKGAIYGKPATDTASYVIGGVGTAKTLGTVEKTVQKSADNFAGDIGKNSTKVDGAKQHAIKEQEISLNFYRDSDTYTAIGQDTFDGKAIWAVKQEKLASPQPADNFTYYDTYKSIDNIQFNRSFGEQAKLEGSYLATKPNATREELAILDEWGNSMRYEAQGYIPPNEQFYAGPAAPQQGYTTQQYLSGGSEQILVRENAPVHQWTNTVIDKETGKTYSIEEFEKAFPNQIKKQKK